MSAVVTELTALRSLRVGGVAVVQEYAAELGPPPGGAGIVLVPWPNRVAAARWTFDGVEQRLDVTRAEDRERLARAAAQHRVRRPRSVRVRDHPGRPVLPPARLPVPPRDLGPLCPRRGRALRDPHPRQPRCGAGSRRGGRPPLPLCRGHPGRGARRHDRGVVVRRDDDRGIPVEDRPVHRRPSTCGTASGWATWSWTRPTPACARRAASTGTGSGALRATGWSSGRTPPSSTSTSSRTARSPVTTGPGWRWRWSR